ncbi:magnesium chelatase subunit D [Pontivivens ytuae]|uniref:Magnesium chelatase subunit D n=1 Tax=Pontivivens ytuae TaxID=2789856 RepID=A0A7S9LS17_9RHOB|nr:magnesium chelatase subunit D [Pontivivens ytuae]QPH54208.1 magnesium chelatase subunit D [Pontivivens ytuae]
MTTDPFTPLRTALALLSIDPAGLGGLWLRARHSPLRSAVIDALALRRMPPTVDDEQLFGGLDVAATLAGSKPVRRQGLLDGTPLMLTMAERTPPALAGRLAAAMDAGTLPTLVLLDEGEEDGAPAALTDRVAFHLSLDGLRLPPGVEPDFSSSVTPGEVETPPAALEALTITAARLGIDSPRAVLFALRAARAHAIHAGRATVTDDDMAAAAALVLAPRAMIVPDEQVDAPPPEQAENRPGEATAPEEMLVEAARAALPPDLAERMALARRRAAKGSGAGARRHGNRRGRPLAPRPGTPRSGDRLDLIATLRAAAPWQRLRRTASPDDTRPVLIAREDLRLKRFEDRSDRLLVFAVDASGSTALARLAEAKGAVELLLAAAYAKRDHVALIAFRGKEAEMLLPPTRALVQAKRRLAVLPGGGGTPLASALALAHETLDAAERRGLSPGLVLMTDGKGNVALDGGTDRAAATAETERLARTVAATGHPALVVDTASRPQPGARQLAQLLEGEYLPLPRADATRLASTITTALAP